MARRPPPRPLPAGPGPGRCPRFPPGAGPRRPGLGGGAVATPQRRAPHPALAGRPLDPLESASPIGQPGRPGWRPVGAASPPRRHRAPVAPAWAPRPGGARWASSESGAGAAGKRRQRRIPLATRQWSGGRQHRPRWGGAPLGWPRTAAAGGSPGVAPLARSRRVLGCLGPGGRLPGPPPALELERRSAVARTGTAVRQFCLAGPLRP